MEKEEVELDKFKLCFFNANSLVTLMAYAYYALKACNPIILVMICLNLVF